MATAPARHEPRWTAGGGIGPPISAIAFSPDGSRIVATDRAGVEMLWAPAYEQPIARIAAGVLRGVTVARVDGDGRH